MRFVHAIAAGLVLAVFLILLYPGKQSNNNAYSTTVESLQKSLEGVTQGSKEEQRILGLLRIARSMHTRPTTEDPSAFMRAL